MSRCPLLHTKLYLIGDGLRKELEVDVSCARPYDELRDIYLSEEVLMSIPRTIGGGLLAVLDTGLAALTVLSGGVTLVSAAVVGYPTIDALMRLIERVPFWGVCFGLSGLAIVAGLLVL